MLSPQEPAGEKEASPSDTSRSSVLVSLPLPLLPPSHEPCVTQTPTLLPSCPNPSSH